jgi:hypothetical protein
MMWDVNIIEELTRLAFLTDQYPQASITIALLLVTLAVALWFWASEDESAVTYSVNVPHQCLPGWNEEPLTEPSLKACMLLL